MASEKAVKCAHPLCSCVTTSGKYCSASVRQRKRRRRSLVRAHTPDAKARRTSHQFLIG